MFAAAGGSKVLTRGAKRQLAIDPVPAPNDGVGDDLGTDGAHALGDEPTAQPMAEDAGVSSTPLESVTGKRKRPGVADLPTLEGDVSVDAAKISHDAGDAARAVAPRLGESAPETMVVQLSDDQEQQRKLDVLQGLYVAATRDVEKAAQAFYKAKAVEAPDPVAVERAQECSTRALAEQLKARRAYFAQDRVRNPTLLSAETVEWIKGAATDLKGEPDCYYFTEAGQAMIARRTAQTALAEAEKREAPEDEMRELERALEEAHALEKELNPTRRYCSCMVQLKGDKIACVACSKHLTDDERVKRERELAAWKVEHRVAARKPEKETKRLAKEAKKETKKDKRKNHHAQSTVPKDANGFYPCGRGCGRTFTFAAAAIAHTKACKHGAPVQAADCPAKPKARKRKAVAAPDVAPTPKAPKREQVGAPASATPSFAASAFGATVPPPPPTFLYATPDGCWNIYGDRDALGRRWCRRRE